MDHATECFAKGDAGIPDQHGEFFLASLAGALELYRDQVSAEKLALWRIRLGPRSPLRGSHVGGWRGARVEERTCSAKMRMATDMLCLIFRLTRSAPGQKAEAKPVGNHRERSQDRPVMDGHEVACFPGEMGLPLGQSQERASPFLAKFDLSASFATGRDAVYAVSGAPLALVVQAATSRVTYVRFTDEVPRCPVLGRVSPGYKSHTKGQGHASETGTAFPRPRPKGCQQRQSRGLRLRLAASACSERQNLRVPPGPLRSMGPVSPATAATKWRDGTSSCQLAGPLSNSPLQPEPGQAAVRSR